MTNPHTSRPSIVSIYVQECCWISFQVHCHKWTHTTSVIPWCSGFQTFWTWGSLDLLTTGCNCLEGISEVPLPARAGSWHPSSTIPSHHHHQISQTDKFFPGPDTGNSQGQMANSSTRKHRDGARRGRHMAFTPGYWLTQTYKQLLYMLLFSWCSGSDPGCPMELWHTVWEPCSNGRLRQLNML